MAVAVGHAIPDVGVQKIAGGGDPEPVGTKEYFAGRTVALFAVPGAFTPTCSVQHLPSYVEKADALKAKGVDVIACTAVNDAFVLKAWGAQQDPDGAVEMLADGGGAFAKALGLGMETGDFGGLRSQRYAMLVKDGVIAALQIEEPMAYKVSSAEALLEAI